MSSYGSNARRGRGWRTGVKESDLNGSPLIEGCFEPPSEADIQRACRLLDRVFETMPETAALIKAELGLA